MNAAERARMEYLREVPDMELDANISAKRAAIEYAYRFDRAHEAREIRRASERAQWVNIILPLIRAGKYFGAAPEAR